MELQESIIRYLSQKPGLSSSEIHEHLKEEFSYSTVKRKLQELSEKDLIVREGNRRSARYLLGKGYQLFFDIDINEYFNMPAEKRNAKTGFDFDLIRNTLTDVRIFSLTELEILNTAQNQFQTKISSLTDAALKRDLEQLAIDLSWKSSQIEGNTYSLLETEQLLKYQQTASGKTKDEAQMLLNHKEAIDFVIGNRSYLSRLSISRIENLHSILIKDLNVDRNLRKRKVIITGTDYIPPDNEFQIIDAVEDMCILINKKSDVFEKAILTLSLISYIQPFLDGNKRTARITSNAILLNNNYCPLSFRTVDPIDYKKAMLLFYEQNNISAIKKMFIEQYQFAVNTYF
jgi:Fic family protein